MVTLDRVGCSLEIRFCEVFLHLTNSLLLESTEKVQIAFTKTIKHHTKLSGHGVRVPIFNFWPFCSFNTSKYSMMIRRRTKELLHGVNSFEKLLLYFKLAQFLQSQEFIWHTLDWVLLHVEALEFLQVTNVFWNFFNIVLRNVQNLKIGQIHQAAKVFDVATFDSETFELGMVWQVAQIRKVIVWADVDFVNMCQLPHSRGHWGI